MGTAYKETFTKLLPTGAEVFTRKGERFARWKDSKGATRTAPLTTSKNGTDRLVITAGTYTAKYRDGSGIVCKVSTGCRDEAAARSVLGELERRAEKVKGKILTADEAAAIDHQEKPLAEHVAAFIAHQQAKGIAPMRIDTTQSRLDRIANECAFRRLADLNGAALERWLGARQSEGMGAVTRNGHREAWVTFDNWCVRNRRLLSNPFIKVPKADEKADPRRKRRALTEAELIKLLGMARRRPLIDAMTIRRGKRKAETVAKLSDSTRRRLEQLGRERALIYKTLLLTGLRKGELASLTVGQLVLDAPMPYLVLDATDEKNRQGNSLPLRADLADDLRQWLADKKATAQEAAGDAATVRFDSQAAPPATKAASRNPAGRQGRTCQPLTTSVSRNAALQRAGRSSEDSRPRLGRGGDRPPSGSRTGEVENRQAR